ncbi:MAG: MMPL family transporter, partial [Planctomycetota bacterium]
DLRMAGPTVDGAAIDVESRKALNSFMWVTVVIVFLLSWYRLQDFAISLTVLGFSLGCAFLSLSILYWSGGTMNLTMIMMPTLTFILGVSASVHMANYYRKAVSEGAGWEAADIALKAGAVPITLSSITTAIGLASLAASQVTPIRMFGIYSAIGIIASLPIILLLMPAVMFQFRGRISRRSRRENKSRREQETGVSHGMSKLVHIVCRYHGLVSIPAIIALLILSFGISFLKGSVKLQNRFAERTKIIQDYQWLEENLGPLVPLEIVVTFDKGNDLPSWQQMLLIEKVEKDLLKNDLGAASMSAATFKPKFPKGNNIANLMQRKIGIEIWQNQEQNLIDAKLIQFDNKDRLWRISLRVAALNDLDYGVLLEAVEDRVKNKIAEFKQEGVAARFTGGIPLFYHAQHQILSDLKNSFVTAFLFISIVLMVVLNSFRAGLVAMIPNVFPPLFVFGAMGWLGLPIEIGSVMTASVALGIAVDDTIHFLTRYEEESKRGGKHDEIIRRAFTGVGSALLMTTIVLIAGLG